ncbi:MAG: chlorophyll synthase ChlG [Chlorobiaceae bacterium]
MNKRDTLIPEMEESISEKLHLSGVSDARQKVIRIALKNVNKPGFRIDPSAIVPLMKPVTWFPPMWAFACGVVSTGENVAANWSILLRGVLLAGPLMCAMSQTMNDYFDREVDAINEPERPIPAGKISKSASWLITFGLILSGFLVALSIHPYVVVIAFVGVLMSHAYSGPPVRAKRNGWFGNLIVGLAYEGVAWLTGSFAITQGVPSAETIALAIIFSLGAHGIMTLNDFKSIVGDKIRHVASIPVQLGERSAAILASVLMDAAQLAAIAILVSRGAITTTVIGLLLLGAQLPMQKILIDNPEKKAIWYNSFGTLLYVLSMMVCAVGIRP